MRTGGRVNNLLSLDGDVEREGDRLAGVADPGPEPPMLHRRKRGAIELGIETLQDLSGTNSSLRIDDQLEDGDSVKMLPLGYGAIGIFIARHEMRGLAAAANSSDRSGWTTWRGRGRSGNRKKERGNH